MAGKSVGCSWLNGLVILLPEGVFIIVMQLMTQIIGWIVSMDMEVYFEIIILPINRSQDYAN